MKGIAKAYICNEIDKLTKEELFDVFWSGRQQYGGDFDVEAIACVRELKKEAADTCWYVTLLAHQRES